MISVSIDRTSLSLSALVIGDHPDAGTYWLPEGEFVRPAFAAVHTTANESAYVDGRTLLAVRRDQDELTFTVYARAANSGALETARNALAAALWQYPCPITVTEDGVATVYDGWPSVPRWNDRDSGMTRAHLARATCVVPVNP
jgi:hypothetical protein